MEIPANFPKYETEEERKRQFEAYIKMKRSLGVNGPPDLDVDKQRLIRAMEYLSDDWNERHEREGAEKGYW